MGQIHRLLTAITVGAGIVFSIAPAGAYEPNVPRGESSASAESYRSALLGAIVQPIRTVTEYPDRTIEVNVGSGFIVGRFYFTVYHNIRAGHAEQYSRQRISVDGTALHPVFTDPSQDVAVFELSDDLCLRYCNRMGVAAEPVLEPGRPVYWLRKYNGELELKESTILNVAVLGDLPSGPVTASSFSCSANLVVEIARPFIPGSSGAPVMDGLTGEIIGIIQGSLEADGRSTGYFKPIHCVRFQRAALNPTRLPAPESTLIHFSKRSPR